MLPSESDESTEIPLMPQTFYRQATTAGLFNNSAGLLPTAGEGSLANHVRHDAFGRNIRRERLD
jgi:hypothetical protein